MSCSQRPTRLGKPCPWKCMTKTLMPKESHLPPDKHMKNHPHPTTPQKEHQKKKNQKSWEVSLSNTHLVHTWDFKSLCVTRPRGKRRLRTARDTSKDKTRRMRMPCSETKIGLTRQWQSWPSSLSKMSKNNSQPEARVVISHLLFVRLQIKHHKYRRVWLKQIKCNLVS